MISEIEKVIDDTEYFEPKTCAMCKERDAEEGETECKFCWRKGKTVGFRNLAKPTWATSEPMSGYDQVRLNS